MVTFCSEIEENTPRVKVLPVGLMHTIFGKLFGLKRVQLVGREGFVVRKKAVRGGVSGECMYTVLFTDKGGEQKFNFFEDEIKDVITPVL